VGILPTAGPGARPCAPPSGCPWSRELLAAPSHRQAITTAKATAVAKEAATAHGSGHSHGHGHGHSKGKGKGKGNGQGNSHGKFDREDKTKMSFRSRHNYIEGHPGNTTTSTKPISRPQPR
jgi:hypothetical protein